MQQVAEKKGQETFRPEKTLRIHPCELVRERKRGERGINLHLRPLAKAVQQVLWYPKVIFFPHAADYLNLRSFADSPSFANSSVSLGALFANWQIICLSFTCSDSVSVGPLRETNSGRYRVSKTKMRLGAKHSEHLWGKRFLIFWFSSKYRVYDGSMKIWTPSVCLRLNRPKVTSGKESKETRKARKKFLVAVEAINTVSDHVCYHWHDEQMKWSSVNSLMMNWCNQSVSEHVTLVLMLCFRSEWREKIYFFLIKVWKNGAWAATTGAATGATKGAWAWATGAATRGAWAYDTWAGVIEWYWATAGTVWRRPGWTHSVLNDAIKYVIISVKLIVLRKCRVFIQIYHHLPSESRWWHWCCPCGRDGKSSWNCNWWSSI